MKTIFVLIVLIIQGLITSCNKDNNVDNLTTSVSGEISYNGLYTGQQRTIYIRGYTTNSKATGTPEYMTSISNTGSYSIDLDGYTGQLYLSAFMDIDNSGSTGGPSANEALIDGVHADPGGCYGDYTFENEGPIKIAIDGAVTGINFELQDNGVIKASFPNAGHCTFGVIKNHVLSDELLHHTHCNVTSTNDTFLLAVPVKDSWFCKVKFDNLSAAQLYPDSVNVTANSVSEINF